VPDPFYSPPRAPEARPPATDPFGALGPEPDLSPPPPVAAPPTAAPAVSPTSFEDFDPFGPPDSALHDPAPPEPPIEEGLPPTPKPPPPYMAGASGSGSLSLEELTTPPARRLSPPRQAEPAPMALLGATEDPFGPAPLGPGLSELDAGVITSSAGPHTAGAPFEHGTEYAAQQPIQIDPFAAAAVAADPLVVDEPSRGAAAVAGAEAPPETTAEAAVSRRAFQLRDVLVSAMALAALLLLSLAILVIWRGGLSPADAFRPSAIVAALAPRTPTGALTASGLQSGLYERARGAPLLFVRGEVVSRAKAPLEDVRVVVEVVRDGAVLACGEVLAGAVPGPEALHGALDAEALARALAEAAPPTIAPLAPGATVPFFIAFLDYPANLAGASLRVQPVAGPAR
jgi:hypothetical protein